VPSSSGRGAWKANKVLADNVYRIAACAAAFGRNGLKLASDGDSSFLRFLEPWLDPLKGMRDVDMTSALTEQEQLLLERQRYMLSVM
jgi:hypothetical protein